ncbi:DMT family transporter [Bacillus sp. Marseille-P3661]|uniref:DMT family transporter n=1 Tax=Bacillus sp. Marseille-P3661 TaxID=1936234 RepID=UPI000C837BE1|nr:EamA family transporter [Bacillus sp. Marseille-P3661]
MLRLNGILMIIIGSMLWGATGPLMEWLLENMKLTVTFLLVIRLIVAGILLLLILAIRKKDILAVWKKPLWRNQLILFSIFGMLGMQYTFVSAIEASNAVLATLLQFSAPIFIVIYVSLVHKNFPPRYQIIGIVGTLIGLIMLLTKGSVSSLVVSKEAILWGVGLGLTFAFYTLYPARLMKEWDILIIVGWSMLIGGIVLGMVSQVWKAEEWSILAQPNVAFMLSALLLFGTMAFVFFLCSMKYISAVETSVLSTFEPLTAMVISVIWFGTSLDIVQLLGVVIMLVFVTWLSVGGNSKATVGEEMTIT